MDAEHPIPQEVSSYQFKLVGDMTLMQFFQVAGGALVSLVIYSSNLAGYVKWPLIIVSFLVGVAFAFFPIEDRPLTKWLVLFMKAIYSPTVYVWNKKAVRHSFFQPENDPAFAQSLQQVQTPIQQVSNTPAAVADTQSASELDKLEAKEQAFLNKVDVEFSSPVITASPQVVSATSNAQTTLKQDISVPGIQTVKVDKQSNLNPQSTTTDIFNSSSSVGNQVTPSATQNLQVSQSAVFSPDAAPPSPPTSPNIIVGQVLDATGKIIDSAILEIKDREGRSVRALRTNRLGHFMIVTPLTNGKYQIETEKDGYEINPITISLEGRVIPPIMITGKKVVITAN